MKKIGIIGKGYWGKILEKNLYDISNIKFIVDSKTDYIPLLKGIDWIFVATPDQTHYNIVKKCLEQNVNVFCEKPLTLTYKESKSLYKLANKIEEQEWKELWQIFEGQDIRKYGHLLKKYTPEEQKEKDIWNEWFDGSGMRSWWD